MKFPAAKDLDFDIDNYLNRYVPPSQLPKLPKRVSWWLGYRTAPVQDIGSILVWWWSFFGAFVGILTIGAMFRYGPVFQDRGLPVIIGSLGASAILEYNTVQSPLAQPRNSIVGHTLSALVGVAVVKLFMLRDDYDDIRWVVGAITCGLSSSVMGMTNTIHPPGGATALLAAVDTNTIKLGWYFVPLVLLSSIILTAIALIINNIQRQYPNFWWTPKDVGRPKQPDVETLSPKPTQEKAYDEFKHPRIIVDVTGVVIPEGFALGWEEDRVLQILHDRLRDQYDVQPDRQQSSTTTTGSQSDQKSQDGNSHADPTP